MLLGPDIAVGVPGKGSITTVIVTGVLVPQVLVEVTLTTALPL
jgi:hypothetical protein